MLCPLLAAGRSVQLEERGSSWDALDFLGAILPHFRLPETAAVSDLSQRGNSGMCLFLITALYTSSGSDLFSSSFSSTSSIQNVVHEAPELCSMSPGELPKLEGVGGLERRGLCYTHLLRPSPYRSDIRALSGSASYLNMNGGLSPLPNLFSPTFLKKKLKK